MSKKLLLWIVGIITLVAILTISYFRLKRNDHVAITPTDRAAVHLMPLPLKLKLTGNVLTLTRPPEIRFSGFHNSQLILASDRFMRNLSLIYQTSLSDSMT